MNRAAKIIVIAVIVLVAAALVWKYAVPHTPAFCFNFERNMQYGDRSVEHPVNQGFQGAHGMMYYLPEVPALQAALKDQGFTIDPLELTGGRIYYGSFFGPSTQLAVKAFQKKYGLEQTGEVDDPTADKLKALYACPQTAATATSTASAATTSTSTRR